MLVFDGAEVVSAVVTLRALEDALDRAHTESKTKVLTRNNAKTVRKFLDDLLKIVDSLQARTSKVAIQELRKRLVARKLKITYEQVKEASEVIRVTFRRELSFAKMFCVEPKYEGYFDINLTTFGPDFGTGFPTAIYEIDEAGKCHALGRSTASVFHLMRAVEIGIRAAARSLGIPDPIKGVDRNWGQMLGKIKAEMDRRSTSTPPQWGLASDKEFFAEIYASLDAVRVAWRNTTMHVENKYTEDESEHIFVSVRGFLKKLASRMDEQGAPAA